MNDARPRQVQRGQLPPTCRVYNQRSGCPRSGCQELHLCSQFLRGRCTDIRCTKAHTLETTNNLQLLSELGWSGRDDLSQALSLLQQWAAKRAVSVCFIYNMGICTAADCGRLHVCYRYAIDKCPLVDCDLHHDMKGEHNAKLLKSACLDDEPVPELEARLRKETLEARPFAPALCRYAYGRQGQGCQRHCLRFHLCWAFARGHCRHGDKCYDSHNLQDDHNQRVLAYFCWTDEYVLRELRAHTSDRSASQADRPRPRRPFPVDDDVNAAGPSHSTPRQERSEWQQKEKEWQREKAEWEREKNDWQQKEKAWERERKEWKVKEARWKLKEAEWERKEAKRQREREQWHQEEKEWQREREEWQQKKKAWERERKEWKVKEAKWQLKEVEWERNEAERKELDNTPYENQQMNKTRAEKRPRTEGRN